MIGISVWFVSQPACRQDEIRRPETGAARLKPVIRLSTRFSACESFFVTGRRPPRHNTKLDSAMESRSCLTDALSAKKRTVAGIDGLPGGSPVVSDSHLSEWSVRGKRGHKAPVSGTFYEAVQSRFSQRWFFPGNGSLVDARYGLRPGPMS